MILVNILRRLRGKPALRKFLFVSPLYGYPGSGPKPTGLYIGWNYSLDPYTPLTEDEVEFYKKEGKL